MMPSPPIATRPPLPKVITSPGLLSGNLVFVQSLLSCVLGSLARSLATISLDCCRAVPGAAQEHNVANRSNEPGMNEVCMIVVISMWYAIAIVLLSFSNHACRERLGFKMPILIFEGTYPAILRKNVNHNWVLLHVS